MYVYVYIYICWGTFGVSFVRSVRAHICTIYILIYLRVCVYQRTGWCEGDELLAQFPQ